MIDLGSMAGGMIGGLISGVIPALVTRNYYKKQLEDKLERGRSVLNIELNEIRRYINQYTSSNFLAEVYSEIDQNRGRDGEVITEFRVVFKSKADSLKDILKDSNYYFEKEIRRKIENLVEKLQDLQEFRFDQFSKHFAESLAYRTEMSLLSKSREIRNLIDEIIEKL